MSLRLHWGAHSFHWGALWFHRVFTEMSLRFHWGALRFQWDFIELGQYSWPRRALLILLPELPHSDLPHHVPQRPRLFPRDMVISRDLLSWDAMMFLETIVSTHQVTTWVFLFAIREKYNLGKAWGTPGELFDLPWELHDENSLKLTAKLPLPDFFQKPCVCMCVWVYVRTHACEAQLGMERPWEAQCTHDVELGHVFFVLLFSHCSWQKRATTVKTTDRAGQTTNIAVRKNWKVSCGHTQTHKG